MKSDFLTNLFFRALQTVSIATMLVRLLLPVAIVAALYLLWRIARNLEKPPKLTEEVKIVRKSLSEMLKENRTRCKMTQEFVAETIGVSRQAVSKWENGTSEPNTSNLMRWQGFTASRQRICSRAWKAHWKHRKNDYNSPCISTISAQKRLGQWVMRPFSLWRALISSVL